MANGHSKRKGLEYGAMPCIVLERAVREACGIDKCVSIPHWDSKPRVAKTVPPWEREGLCIVSAYERMPSRQSNAKIYASRVYKLTR